jgi:hypothetical protein
MSVEAFLFFALAAVYCAISFPSPSRRKTPFRAQRAEAALFDRQSSNSKAAIFPTG